MYPYNYQQSILPGGGYHCVSDILVIYNSAVLVYKQEAIREAIRELNPFTHKLLAAFKAC